MGASYRPRLGRSNCPHPHAGSWAPEQPAVAAPQESDSLGALNLVTTPLEQAIDSLSDPTAGLADSFRRLLVVSRRIAADDLTDFIRAELDGYEDRALVPPTRKAPNLAVSIRFDGFRGSHDTLRVGAGELPTELVAVLDVVGFTEPVAELEALAHADGDNDPRLELPMAWVMLYRKFIEQQAVPYISMMTPNQAYIALPRTHLRGMLDRLRTAALDLALDLETVSVDAGTPSGPTVASEPRLANIVNNYVAAQAAENATVTVGDNTNVAVGDVSGLFAAAAEYIDPAGVEARCLRRRIQDFSAPVSSDTKSHDDRL